MRNELLDSVCVLLLRKGFAVKCIPRQAFDVVARRGSEIIILKVLQDANSISHDMAAEMLNISSCLSGSPIIIAEKAGGVLEQGVVYSRHGVNTVSLGTFRSCIEGSLPLVMRDKSGFTVSIAGEKLSGEMERHGYSLADVSRRVGVSRQMVARYRDDGSEITVRKAYAMRRMFGDSIFERVDVFRVSSAAESPKSEIGRKYERLGFRAVDARKSPFDIAARKDDQLILTEVGDRPDSDFDAVTSIIDSDRLVIFDRRKPKGRKIPNMTRKEFLDIGTARELIKFLREFE